MANMVGGVLLMVGEVDVLRYSFGWDLARGRGLG